MRILNKNYRVYDKKQNGNEILLQDYIKISYKLGKAKDIVKGKEARIPLDFKDFMEVSHKYPYMTFLC